MKRKKATKENILGLGYEIYGNAYSHPLPFLENIYEKCLLIATRLTLKHTYYGKAEKKYSFSKE
jgi:hypothetical protein